VSQTRFGVVPGLRFGCRANHDKDIELLYQLGARSGGATEFEAGLELTHLLTGMGLSLPVIQQEVQQIRNHYLVATNTYSLPGFP